MADRTITADLVGRDKMSSAFDSAGRSSSKLGDKLKSVAKVGAVAFLAVGAAAIKFGASSARAYAEAEASQSRLEDAFKRFPKLANANIESFRKLNTELARKTKFDDDAFASGQSVLASFDLTAKQLRQMTPLLADYAAKTGKDLPTAAKTLGKAFLGNTRALKDLGINVQLTGDKAKDYAIIQDALNKKVGGFATKEGKTAAGVAARLKNQFGELQEKIGAKLMPILLKFGNWMLDKGIPALIKFGRWIGPKLGAAVDYVRGLFGRLKAMLKGNGDTMENLRHIVKESQKAWEHIKPVVKFFAEVVLLHLKNQLKIIGFVLREVVVPAIKKGLEWFNSLADKVESVVNRVKSAWAKLPDFKVNLPDIPHFAAGGTMLRSGVALVGERGPELVNLPAGARVTPNAQIGSLSGRSGGGGQQQAVVTLNVKGDRAAAAALKTLLRSADIRFVNA